MAIKFEATGDFSDLIAENQKLQRQLVSVTEQLAKAKDQAEPMGAAGKKAFRELERAAEQAKRSIETPTEAFKKHAAQLDQALAKGLLTAEEHTRAIDQLARKYAGAIDPVQKLAVAQAHLDRQLQAGQITQEQYQQALEEKRKSLENTAEAVDDTTQAGQTHGTMMQSLTGRLMALGAGYMSFQAILGKVKEALAYVNQETDKAIASADKMTDPNKRLAQVSTSAEDLDMMVRRADELAARYGEERDVVRRVSFSARSENFESILPELIKYGDVVSPEAAASVAGQVPGLFGEGSIDPLVAVNAVLAAAKESRLEFEKIAQAMPIISAGGAMTGSDPAEVMGILSVIASNTKSGDEAATLFKGLATKLALDQRTSGQGILGGYRTLQGMSDADRADFLGEAVDANTAYNLLSRRTEDVNERIGLVRRQIAVGEEGGTPILEQQYQMVYEPSTETGRTNLALEQRRQAMIGEEIANERQFAIEGALREAAIASEKERQKAAGYSGIAQYGGDVAGNLVSGLQMSPGAARGATAGGTIAMDQTLLGELVRRLGWTTSDREPGNDGAQLVQEMRRLNSTNEQQLETMRAANATLPRVGASAAAAVPSTQRLGR